MCFFVQILDFSYCGDYIFHNSTWYYKNIVPRWPLLLDAKWKMMVGDDYTIYCKNIVSRWHNNHYSWIHTKKMMPSDDHIIYYENIVSRWHNHCHSWICTEKQCITHIHTYRTKKLPNMVSLIAKWTLLLNSHEKTGPRHMSYVPCWMKVNVFPN
jgi:hypothetical protein